MAQYKVIQDIEADDKLFLSLSFKQFVFAGIASSMLAVGYFIGQSTSMAVLFIMLIPAAPFIFLAAPIGRDQPNDVWLAARLRFFFKPRKRLWNQSGIQNFVTVNAPKLEEHVYSDGLSRGEVTNRLKALATTIDSRGWAVKNVNLSTGNPQQQPVFSSGDQRLLGEQDMPQQVVDVDIRPSDDILDSNNSQIGAHFQQLMDDHTISARNAAVAKVQAAVAQQSQAADSGVPADDENNFLEDLHKRQELLGIREGSDQEHTVDEPESHHAKIKRGNNRPHKANAREAEPQIAVADFTKNDSTSSTNTKRTASNDSGQPSIDPAIIKQLSEFDDLKVSTLASMAQHKVQENLNDGEVVINLR